jgi:hypothetical protein
MALVSGGAGAATEIGAITLVEGGARLLRGAVWYKLAPGVPAEEGDIVEALDRTQVQFELTGGTTVNLAGPGVVYAVPGKGGPPLLSLREGWLKVAAKGAGVRVRTPALDVIVAEATVVLRAQGPLVELFIEAGAARLLQLTPSGGDGAARDAKRGEYWSKAAAGAFTTVPRAPRAFVDAMPRHFVDPLPTLKARIKGKPTLAVDHEITYAEAEPWLVGRDRAAFERRFASRLRDPVFRKAADANIARYPLWDRMLHPEKYVPKPVPSQ